MAASARDYAAVSFTKGRPVLEATLDLMGRIFREFEYDPASTTIATPVAEVMEHRRGVCQDFAHIAIAGLRGLGLAIRYVSGYLETLPPPGQIKLQGADASHAWFSVLIPEHGWIDFDPTNDLIPVEQHITTAIGRDFQDVTPVRGIFYGGGTHDLLRRGGRQPGAGQACRGELGRIGAVTSGEPDIVAGHVLQIFQLPIRQRTSPTRWRAEPQIAALQHLTGRHQRPGPDHGARLEDGPIEDAGANADQTVLLDLAPVQHDLMPDGHAVVDDERRPARHETAVVRDVQDAAILDIGLGSDLDAMDVAPDHA